MAISFAPFAGKWYQASQDGGTVTQSNRPPGSIIPG
jgi:hypothetical protein